MILPGSLKLCAYGLLRVNIILIRIGIKLNFIRFSFRVVGCEFSVEPPVFISHAIS